MAHFPGFRSLAAASSLHPGLFSVRPSGTWGIRIGLHGPSWKAFNRQEGSLRARTGRPVIGIAVNRKGCAPFIALFAMSGRYAGASEPAPEPAEAWRIRDLEFIHSFPRFFIAEILRQAISTAEQCPPRLDLDRARTAGRVVPKAGPRPVLRGRSGNSMG